MKTCRERGKIVGDGGEMGAHDGETGRNGGKTGRNSVTVPYKMGGGDKGMKIIPTADTAISQGLKGPLSAGAPPSPLPPPLLPLSLTNNAKTWQPTHAHEQQFPIRERQPSYWLAPAMSEDWRPPQEKCRHEWSLFAAEKKDNTTKQHNTTQQHNTIQHLHMLCLCHCWHCLTDKNAFVL